MSEHDEFTTAIPDVALKRLLRLGNTYAFDPLASNELEAYFVSVLRTHSINELEDVVVPHEFQCVAARPRWLQGANWPVLDGHPGIFLGQFDVPTDSGVVPGETSVYIFASRVTGSVQTVVQSVADIP